VLLSACLVEYMTPARWVMRSQHLFIPSVFTCAYVWRVVQAAMTKALQSSDQDSAQAAIQLCSAATEQLHAVATAVRALAKSRRRTPAVQSPGGSIENLGSDASESWRQVAGVLAQYAVQHLPSVGQLHSTAKSTWRQLLTQSSRAEHVTEGAALPKGDSSSGDATSSGSSSMDTSDQKPADVQADASSLSTLLSLLEVRFIACFWQNNAPPRFQGCMCSRACLPVHLPEVRLCHC
jgi:hypothetical protein